MLTKLWRCYMGNRLVAAILAVCLCTMTLTGCDISSKHLEVTYEENTNENISNWDGATEDNVTGWDSEDVITTWNDVDDYSDWIYAEMLFDDIAEEYPIIECQVLDYKSNGQYFDGDKIYTMVGDKFDANSFVAKYAIGTGVIVICVVLTVATAGSTTPVACFIAGAADGSVTYAAKGAAFGAAMGAVTKAISSGGDIEDTIYGTLEGSSDGYMWGAMYGAITGGLNSTYCFTGDTTVLTVSGAKEIQNITVGDKVMSFDEETGRYEYKSVTQVIENDTRATICIYAGGDAIESTSAHPYWTGEKWVAAGNLVPGEAVVDLRGEKLVVDKIETITYEQPIDTYNLCVEDYHSYLVGANGIVVHNRCNINSEYAGKTKYLDDPELAKKYPDGVPFTKDGFPDFSKYATNTVKFEMPSAKAIKADTCLTGNCSHDFRLCNEALGFKETPAGFTWHHKEDMMTMELIPTDLHQAVRHTGGASKIKSLLAALP